MKELKSRTDKLNAKITRAEELATEIEKGNSVENLDMAEKIDTLVREVSEAQQDLEMLKHMTEMDIE